MVAFLGANANAALSAIYVRFKPMAKPTLNSVTSKRNTTWLDRTLTARIASSGTRVRKRRLFGWAAASLLIDHRRLNGEGCGHFAQCVESVGDRSAVGTESLFDNT